MLIIEVVLQYFVQFILERKLWPKYDMQESYLICLKKWDFQLKACTKIAEIKTSKRGRRATQNQVYQKQKSVEKYQETDVLDENSPVPIMSTG